MSSEMQIKLAWLCISQVGEYNVHVLYILALYIRTVQGKLFQLRVGGGGGGGHCDH